MSPGHGRLGQGGLARVPLLRSTCLARVCRFGVEGVLAGIKHYTDHLLHAPKGASEPVDMQGGLAPTRVRAPPPVFDILAVS